VIVVEALKKLKLRQKIWQQIKPLAIIRTIIIFRLILKNYH
jgi:hypothetical protein